MRAIFYILALISRRRRRRTCAHATCYIMNEFCGSTRQRREGSIKVLSSLGNYFGAVCLMLAGYAEVCVSVCVGVACRGGAVDYRTFHGSIGAYLCMKFLRANSAPN